MIRTQIQLTEDQAKKLKEAAARYDVSVAELIRQSVDRYLAADVHPSQETLKKKSLTIIGKYASQKGDISANHDDYLDDIYGDEAR